MQVFDDFCSAVIMFLFKSRGVLFDLRGLEALKDI